MIRVYEVLWAFHAANFLLEHPEEERVDRLATQLTRRLIRDKPEDEFEMFTRWVARVPNSDFDPAEFG